MTVPPSTRPTAAEDRAARGSDGSASCAMRSRDTHPGIVDLSMGMSLDYGAAVEEGATMVRIGTALFGSEAVVM